MAVPNLAAPNLPILGEILTNSEIAQRFSVGSMGGMRRSLKGNLLVLISDPFKGLYHDRWEGNILHYTGMGPVEDQSLTYAQNKTLADAPNTGISLHLLESLEPLRYTYAGQVVLAGAPYQESQPDGAGAPRKVWMFPLRLADGVQPPLITDSQARQIENVQAQLARRLSLEDLKARAQSAKGRAPRRTIEASVYVRDAAVAELAKRLANGVCDLCESPAPFQNKQQQAYLECHHVLWLAKGGPDSIENTVALCPNCHRKMHILDKKADKAKLLDKAAARARP